MAAKREISMQELILLKLGEVVLKGLNRHTFEDKLLANLRRRMKNYGDFRISSKQSTIYVEPAEEGWVHLRVDALVQATCTRLPSMSSS